MEKKLAIREISEDFARPLFDSVVADSDYGILVTDLNHKSLLCNKRFGEIWGVEISRVVSATVDEVRDYVVQRVSDLESWRKNLDEIYRDPRAIQIDELTLRDPFSILRRYTGPILDVDGNVIGRLWTFLEVTREVKRRRMLEALHEAGTMMDSSPAVVYQGLVDKVAEYFESWAFLSLIKGDYLEFRVVSGLNNPARSFPGNDLRDSFCQFCIEQDGPFVIQDVNDRPDLPDVLPKRAGMTRYAGVPIRTANGSVIGTLCILDCLNHDAVEEEDVQFLSQVATRIGGELEREDALKKLEASLDVTLGSLKVAQQNLIQSEKLAITGTLSASISHDIRNILASMQMQLLDSRKTPEQRLDLLGEQMTRFKVLSHRLLSYSRPVEPFQEQIDLHETIMDAVELLDPQARLHDVFIEINLEATDAWILGDKQRLQHLFVNLILNSIQAMGGGGVIRIMTSLSGENQIEVSVYDNGQGIHEEVLRRLFEPFSSEKPDGFGLGLYSCREIVRAHNSELKCESALCEGTRFYMTFERTS
ncbi:MAG: ATP-binding protein [Fimbriimonadaceae bacterium]